MVCVWTTGVMVGIVFVFTCIGVGEVNALPIITAVGGGMFLFLDAYCKFWDFVGWDWVVWISASFDSVY